MRSGGIVFLIILFSWRANISQAPDYSQATSLASLGPAQMQTWEDNMAFCMLMLAGVVPEPSGTTGLHALVKQRPDAIFALSRVSQKKTVETDSVRQLTAANIESIFQHEYAPEKFGAKGLVYRDLAYGPVPFFWKTGNGKIANEVHHRDVMAFVYRRSDLDLLEVLGYATAQADRIVIESDTSLTDNQARLLGLAEFVYEIASVRDRGILDLSATAGQISQLREQRSFPKDSLLSFIGFQLTAQRNPDGRLRVTRLEVDSSIGTAIRSRTEEFGQGLTFEHLRQFGTMIDSIHEAVDEEIRAYRSVFVRNLHRLNFVRPVWLPNDHLMTDRILEVMRTEPERKWLDPRQFDLPAVAFTQPEVETLLQAETDVRLRFEPSPTP